MLNTLRFVFILSLSAFVAAEQKPLWEIGAGLGTFITPDYLGADETSSYVLPFPQLIYRGDIFRSDRGGLSGKLFTDNNWELNVSLSGSLPVNSEDNKAREGMEDLDALVEVGPAIQYHFIDESDHVLRIDIPVRAAISVSSSPAYEGLISNPRVYWRKYFHGWRVTTTLGPMYASQKFHRYFYDVEEAYVTPDRSFYRSGSGMLSMKYSLSLSRYFDDWFVGGVINYHDLHHAKNKESPLLIENDFMSFGLAVSYVFRRSKTMVSQ